MRRSLSLALLVGGLSAPTVLAQNAPADRPAPGGTAAPATTTERTTSAAPGGFFGQGRTRGGVADQSQPPIGEQAPNQQRSAAARPINDAMFAAVAADGGLAEVAVSQVGMQRASNMELKRLSQQMIQEHDRLNQELMQLAGQKRLNVPRTVNPRTQFCLENLSGVSSEKFDACYAKAQLAMHMEAAAAFEAEAERGQDPEIKAMAAKALPRIKEHLQMFRMVAERLSPGDSSLQRTSTELPSGTTGTRGTEGSNLGRPETGRPTNSGGNPSSGSPTGGTTGTGSPEPPRRARF